MAIVRKQEVQLEFQPYIPHAPLSTGQMYSNACGADTVTCNAWRDTWISNAKANKERFGSFADNSVGQLFGLFRNKPVIVAGSGPSLKHNASKLKDRGQIGLVSCLHNFHYMEDLGANVDLYVSLDAGPITITEVSEGGSRTPEEYWALTKDRTLAAFIGTDPELLKKWQGKVLFYRCPIPDEHIENAFEEVESFHTYVSCGGNVLGSCFYIAKCFLGGNPIVFIGADFSFGYDVSSATGHLQFHPWHSQYDKGIGNVMAAVDVFGNRVKTWPSYWAFKNFFDRTVIEVPGIYINATEGGIFGAYPDGNVCQLLQMTLDDVYRMYNISDNFKGQATQPSVRDKRICF